MKKASRDEKSLLPKDLYFVANDITICAQLCQLTTECDPYARLLSKATMTVS